MDDMIAELTRIVETDKAAQAVMRQAVDPKLEGEEAQAAQETIWQARTVFNELRSVFNKPAVAKDLLALHNLAGETEKTAARYKIAATWGALLKAEGEIDRLRSYRHHARRNARALHVAYKSNLTELAELRASFGVACKVWPREAILHTLRELGLITEDDFKAKLNGLETQKELEAIAQGGEPEVKLELVGEQAGRYTSEQPGA